MKLPSTHAPGRTLPAHTGTDVTILVSQKAGRYRIQAATIEAVWLVFGELQRRLVNFFKLAGGAALEISFGEQLPLPAV